MPGIEGAHAGRPRLLHLGQFRPAGQEVQRQRTGQFVAAQQERLRIKPFEQTAQLVGHLGALVDGRAPGGDQRRELAGLRPVEFQARELVAMLLQQSQQHPRIGTVVLGAGERKRPPEARAGRRVHRIDCQPGMLEQGAQKRVASGFDRQRHLAPSAAFSQLIEPVVQRLGTGGDGPRFERVCRSDPQRKRVFLVTPIHGHQGRIVIVFHGGFWFGGTGLQIVLCGAWGRRQLSVHGRTRAGRSRTELG